MTMHGAPWLKSALIGIRDAVEWQAGGETAVMFNHLAQQGDDAALAFCRAAGVWAACRQAAVVPELADISCPVSAERGDDVLPPDHPWCAVFEYAFEEKVIRLQTEACRILAQQRRVLPPRLLRLALEAGQRHQALRPVLLEVLGQRGRWLAQFNSSWQYANSSVDGHDDDRGDLIWEEGAFVQRLEFFRRLRGTDPARARALLQAQLKELPAKERQAFVALLQHHLHPDDQALLEQLLKDRSGEVRDGAAMLLAQLPESPHAKSLIGWLAPLVTEKQNLMSRLASLVTDKRQWCCEAPLEVNPAWAAAAISAKRPQHSSMGDRAWWLYQLVRQVPLSWWQSHTGMTPEALLKWAKKTDWSEALYEGWLDRVEPGDDDWIVAMLNRNNAAYKQQVPLVTLLSPTVREEFWPSTLEKLIADRLLRPFVASYAYDETISEGHSRVLLRSVLPCLKNGKTKFEYDWRSNLLELACMLHPDSLSSWPSFFEHSEDESSELAEFMTDFGRIVALRRVLHSPCS